MRSALRFLMGRRLATDEDEDERVGVLAGIPIVGLAALASAVYGPDALLSAMMPLGVGGLHFAPRLTLLIVGLLILVTASYYQVINVYPTGGGAYAVAKDNVGTNASLLSASTLLLDYLLNVAVAISAGIGLRDWIPEQRLLSLRSVSNLFRAAKGTSARGLPGRRGNKDGSSPKD